MKPLCLRSRIELRFVFAGGPGSASVPSGVCPQARGGQTPELGPQACVRSAACLRASTSARTLAVAQCLSPLSNSGESGP